jgi:hypothetical protein
LEPTCHNEAKVGEFWYQLFVGNMPTTMPILEPPKGLYTREAKIFQGTYFHSTRKGIAHAFNADPIAFTIFSLF